MIVWLDNHLSPDAARWIGVRFGCDCFAIRDLGFARAADVAIFDAAGAKGAVLVTKDSDFANLVERRGPPPHIIWLTCGNTSTTQLCALLETRFERAMALIAAGESLVEIG